MLRHELRAAGVQVSMSFQTVVEIAAEGGRLLWHFARAPWVRFGLLPDPLNLPPSASDPSSVVLKKAMALDLPDPATRLLVSRRAERELLELVRLRPSCAPDVVAGLRPAALSIAAASLAEALRGTAGCLDPVRRFVELALPSLPVDALHALSALPPTAPRWGCRPFEDECGGHVHRVWRRGIVGTSDVSIIRQLARQELVRRGAA